MPVKSIHLNKSPVVIRNLRTLAPERAAQWNLSVEQALRHAEFALALPNMDAIWEMVYQRDNVDAIDVDQDLYNGFIGNNDRRLLQILADSNADKLARATPHFQDERLGELLFRYRARNFPDSLTDVELARWETLRADRFFAGEGGALTVDAFFAEIDRLSETATEDEQAILAALYDYAEQILPQH